MGYILSYKDHLDGHIFVSIPIDGHHRVVYDSSYDINHVTAAGAWVKHWTQWSRRDETLRIDAVVVLLYIGFTRCTEELPYASRWSTVLVCMQTFATMKLQCIV